MSKRLIKIISTLLAVLLFTVLSPQRAAGADITVDDLIGQWEARLKINKLELFGVNESQRDDLYNQEQVPQTLSIYMKDGELMLSFGTLPIPVALSGSKLSGSCSGEFMFNYNVEVILEGTVRKTEKGIEFSINTKQEMWSDNRKDGSIISCTYAGSTPAGETPSTPEDETTPVGEGEEVIPVESITIEPRLVFLKIGATRQLYVKINPPGANAGDVVVESYDGKIVHLYGDGSVVGLKAGYTEITAATRDGSIQTTSRAFVGEDNEELAGIVLDTIWAKTKEFLRGDSFEVQTPTATCGVRG